MQTLMDINYMGTYHAARAALPVFRRQGTGHMILVSSIVGKRGVPYMGAYAATKFAQVGLAECLRSEVSGSGIHVTVVYPVKGVGSAQTVDEVLTRRQSAGHFLELRTARIMTERGSRYLSGIGAVFLQQLRLAVMVCLEPSSSLLLIADGAPGSAPSLPTPSPPWKTRR